MTNSPYPLRSNFLRFHRSGLAGATGLALPSLGFRAIDEGRSYGASVRFKF